MIFDKLSEKPGISYAEVAKEAFKVGRIKLATKLLEYEPFAADQVPLLLSMQQDELALKKSIDSCDTDLSKSLSIDASTSCTLSHEKETICTRVFPLDQWKTYRLLSSRSLRKSSRSRSTKRFLLSG